MTAVLGVDRCRKGWAGVLLAGRSRPLGLFGATLTDLLGAAPAPPSVVAVDIPIGLPDRGRRRADTLAKQLLGSRSATLFLTPTRAAVGEPDRAAASRRNVELGGPGVTAQAYALVAAIREADLFVAGVPGVRVVECHPECSFAEMNDGQPLAAPKHTWQGLHDRLELLSHHGIDLRDAPLGEVGRRAAPDDVVDAAATAWTAGRVAEGRARSLPDPPERFAAGPDAAIWV